MGIKNALKEHFSLSKKTWICKGAAAAGIFLLSVFLIYVFGQLYDRPAADEYFSHTPAGVSTPAVTEGDTLSQSFTSPYDTLREIRLSLDRLGGAPSVMYVVRVYENDELLRVLDFKTQQVADTFNILDTPITGAKGKTYRLDITVGRTTENASAAFQGMTPQDGWGSAVLNGEELGLSLAVDLNAPPTGQASTYVVLLVLLGLCIAGVVLLLGKDPAVNAAVIILAFGFFLCVLNPINDSPDEGAHYIRAETVAQGRLFTSATTPVEVDENINKLMDMRDLEKYQFAKFSDAGYYSMRAGDGVTEVASGTAASYIFYGYLAPAAGLLMAKLLHLPAMTAIFLCRMLNILLYAGLCFAAIRIAPRFKTAFSFFTCFPLCVYLAASFNTDGLTFALSFLLAACILRLCDAQDGSLGAQHIAAVCLLCLSLALTKIPFIAFAILPLCIPKKKFRSSRHYALLWAGIFCVAAVAACWLALSGAKGLRVIDGADSKEQILYMLKNPFAAIHTVLGTFMGEWTVLYTQLFTLGWLYYNFSYVGLIYPFVAYFVLSGEELTEEKALKRWQKVIGVLAVLGASALTYLAMYISSNPVGATVVTGIQGRYFLAIIAMLPLLLGVPREKRARAQAPVTWALWSCSFLVICISNIILRHYM